MLDKKANLFLKPILIPICLNLLKKKFLPNHFTFIGLISGFFCFLFLSIGMVYIAFIFFILNRIFDGIDGTMARLSKPTDLGGYYDIVFDFFVYALVPFGFILFDQKNYLAMSFLLTSFIGTGSTFLATAWILEKNKSKKKQFLQKSFYYSHGLIEGTETIIIFSLMFIFYESANLIAWIFGTLCMITSFIRIINTRKILI